MQPRPKYTDDGECFRMVPDEQYQAMYQALRRIASGQEMSGDYTHADTVAKYTRIASQALAKTEGRQA